MIRRQHEDERRAAVALFGALVVVLIAALVWLHVQGEP
jgi:hypothetical protein